LFFWTPPIVDELPNVDDKPPPLGFEPWLLRLIRNKLLLLILRRL
jgi:hypothetical protein